MRPILDRRKCMVQKDICTAIKTCPVEAIAYVDDENEPLGGRIVFDLAKCSGCGKCAEICCGDAIEMGEDPGSAV